MVVVVVSEPGTRRGEVGFGERRFGERRLILLNNDKWCCGNRLGNGTRYHHADDDAQWGCSDTR